MATKKKKGTNYAITAEDLARTNSRSRFTPYYAQQSTDEVVDEEPTPSSPVLPEEVAPSAESPSSDSWTQKRLGDIIFGDGYTDAAIDTAQAGLQRAGRSALTTALEGGYGVGVGSNSLLGAVLPEAGKSVEEAAMGLANQWAADEKANLEQVKQSGVQENLQNMGWLRRNLGEGGLDALSSASSAASLVGGPLGAVAVADAYNQSFTQAIEAGLDADDAALWGVAQAAPELVSFIPASKVVERLPYIGKAVDRLLKKPVKNIAASIINREGSPALKAFMRTTNSALGEGLEETFTGGLQDVASGAFGTRDDKLGELGRATASTTLGGNEGNGTFTDKLWQSARAGFIMGGGLSSPGNVARSYQDRADFIRDRSNRLTNTVTEQAASDSIVLPSVEEQRAEFAVNAAQSAGYSPQRVAENEANNPNVDRELFNAEQDIAADAAKRKALDDAFNQREEEQALQQAVEEEAGFRTIANQNNSQGTMADAMRNAGVSTEVTPAQVAAEVMAADKAKKEAAAREEARKEELRKASARVAEINRVAARRKARAEMGEKKAAEEKKKSDSLEGALRTKAVDSLMDEGLQDHEIVDALPARITQMREEAAAKKGITDDPVLKKIASIRNAIEGQKKKKLAESESKRLSALVKRNPDASPAQIKAMFEGQVKAEPAAPTTKTTPDIAKLKASDSSMDRTQAAALEKLGMAGDSKSGKREVPEDFVPKVRQIFTRLAGDSSSRASAVERLVTRGKIRVVPNPQHMGFEASSRKGEYDPKTGITYVYTDNLTDGTHAEFMNAASHETGHQVQYADRDARPEQLKRMLGTGITDGSRILRVAAKKGNKFAQEALRRAEEDTEQRRKDGQENPARYEDVELVAYAIGNENAGRTSSLGSASGALRDVVAGARKVLRDKLGLDLDVSLGDVRSAMAQVLEEGTRTSKKGGKAGDRLGMIAGRKATNAARAEAEGRMYNLPGIPDSKDRWEFSDSEAELNTGNLVEGLERVSPTNAVSSKLSTALNHKRLFEEYPQLKDYKLRLADLGAGKHGQFDRDNETITLNSRLLNAAIDNPNEISPVSETGLTNYEFARNVMLHEVQHAVQRIEGFSGGASYNSSMVNKARDNRNNAMQEYNDYITMWADQLPDVVDTLPDDTRRDWAEMLAEGPVLSPVGQARLFLEIGLGQQSSTSRYRNSAARFSQVDAKKNAAHKAYVDAKQLADQTYYDVHGEVEARNTETRSRMTEEDIAGTNPIDTYDTPVGDTLPSSGERVVSSEGGRLGMAGDSKPAKARIRNRNKFGTLITSLLRNDKGLGAPVRDALERARQDSAITEADLNRLAGRYDSALKKEAAARGVSPEELNKEVRAKMNEVYATEGAPSELRAALKAALSPYGAAGERMLDMRQFIDDQSQKLLQDALERGGKLSAEFKKQLRAVAANLGKYEHRFYANDQQGTKWADAVTQSVNRHKKGKKLNKAQEDMLDRYNKASKFMFERVYIPDESAIDELSPERVNFLYSTWVSTVDDGSDLETKKEALLSRRDFLDSDDYKSKTEENLDAILYGVDNVATRAYSRGQKVNTGILEKRSKIPPEIRQLLGEITDPAAALLVTGIKQGQLMAQTRAMMDIRDNALPEDLQPPDGGNAAQRRANNMTQLSGKGYGALDGYWAAPAMRSMIDDTIGNVSNLTDALLSGSGLQMEQAFGAKAVRGWMRGASVSKAMTVIGNVINSPINFYGAMFMPLFNGNWDVRTYKRGLEDAVAIIRYARNPSLGIGTARDAVKYGVTDSATVGDLRTLDETRIQKVMKEMTGKSPGYLLSLAGRGVLTFREAYAMMDVWAKMANFHNEVDHLTRLYKAEGQNKTEEQIKQEAAAATNRTNISYQRALPAAKLIERLGFTRFAPYLYETHRIMVTNLIQGVNEAFVRPASLTTPKAKALSVQRGLSRLAGQGAYWYLVNTVTSIAAAQWAEDDEQEEDIRALLNPDMRNEDYVLLGLDKANKPVMYQVSRFDALGPSTNIIRAVRNGDDPVAATIDQLKTNYIAPLFGPKAFSAAVNTVPALRNYIDPYMDIAEPRTPLIQEWFPKGFGKVVSVTGNDSAVKAWANLFEEVAFPGTLRAYGQNNPEVFTPKQGMEEEAALFNNMRYLGARGTRLDPDSAARRASMDYTATMKASRRQLANFVANRPEVTAEQISAEVLSLRREERKAWDEARKVSRGLQALGLSRKEVAAALKDNGMPAATVRSVLNEEFVSSVVSKESFESYAKKKINSVKDPDKREKEADRWEAAWEILGEFE